MKASTKRALSILFSVFFLIVTVIIYTNLIIPELGEIGRLRGEIASKSQTYNVQKNAVSQVAEIVNQFANAQELQKTLSFAMPIKVNISDALNQWYAISKTSEVNVNGLDIQVKNLIKKPANPLLKGRGSIVVNLEAVGTYDALKEFLGSLETNSRLVTVKSFSFSPLGGAVSSAGPLYSLKLEVETYYQVE
jgi:Tfp pilus assembly protein PilO